MRAACSPHVSHFSLFIINPHCYDHESVYISQLTDDHYLSPINGMPSDQVLPFPRCSITLAFYDFSREYRPLYVKYGQCVFIHLIQGMQRDNIPTLTDSRSQAFKDSRVQRVSSHSDGERLAPSFYEPIR